MALPVKKVPDPCRRPGHRCDERTRAVAAADNRTDLAAGVQDLGGVSTTDDTESDCSAVSPPPPPLANWNLFFLRNSTGISCSRKYTPVYLLWLRRRTTERERERGGKTFSLALMSIVNEAGINRAETIKTTKPLGDGRRRAAEK